jgi:hypothetical protein
MSQPLRYPVPPLVVTVTAYYITFKYGRDKMSLVTSAKAFSLTPGQVIRQANAPDQMRMTAYR